MKHRTITALKASIAPRSLHNAARVKIKNLDLEPIKFKLVKESGWTIEQADRVAALYKGFLTLHVLYPDDTHVPTHEIDDMWHAHILDTAKYMDDCAAIFGYYLHHFPYLGLRGESDEKSWQDSFAATRQRFVEICGLDPLSTDELGATGCGGGGCGSSCSSGLSCSSGGGDSGGGHDRGGGDGVPFNPAASCSSSDAEKKKKQPPAKPPANSNDKPRWRRILGLSGRTDTWTDSVAPQSPLTRAKRPGRDDLLQLAQIAPDGVTKH